MFGKMGRWAAGRLQGSQGVQKYDSFMQRNPWANTALNVAGGVALGAATGGIGMLAGGKLGAGIAAAGKWGGRAGLMPGGNYNPGGQGGAATGGLSQIDQLGRTGMMELNDLRDGYKNFSYNDPMDGADYDAPGGDLIDRATGADWMQDDGFDPTIKGDALDEYRSGTFNDTIDGDAMDGMGERFANPFTPGIDGPDAMDEMGGAYTGMMGLSRTGGGAEGFAAGADLTALDNFNADAAFEKYATGANNRFMSSLQSGLNSLRDSAAGGNRLNTGFFDLDSGKLGRDLRQDFSNDIAQAAIQTNQQNLTARQAAAGFRTQLGTATAGNRTQASIANANNRLGALEAASRTADRRAVLQRDDRNFKADRFDVQTKNLFDLGDVQRGDRKFRAERFDENGKRLLNVADRQRDDRKFVYGAGQDRLTRADDRTKNNRSTFLDAAQIKQRGWQVGMDARLRGSEMMDERFRDRRNSYLDMLSGMTDRAQGQDNAREQRRTNSRNSWMQLGGQVAGVAANAWLNRRGGAGGTGGTGSAGSMMSNDMQEWVRQQKPVLTVGGRK